MFTVIFYLVLFGFICYVVVRDFRSWLNRKKAPAVGLSREEVEQIATDSAFAAIMEWDQSPERVEERRAVQEFWASPSPATTTPKPNGHDQAADNEAQIAAIFEMPVVAPQPPTAPAIAVPIPEAPKSEPRDRMCKCGAGPFTLKEFRGHLFGKAKEKGQHGKATTEAK